MFFPIITAIMKRQKFILDAPAVSPAISNSGFGIAEHIDQRGS